MLLTYKLDKKAQERADWKCKGVSVCVQTASLSLAKPRRGLSQRISNLSAYSRDNWLSSSFIHQHHDYQNGHHCQVHSPIVYVIVNRFSEKSHFSQSHFLLKDICGNKNNIFKWNAEHQWALDIPAFHVYFYVQWGLSDVKPYSSRKSSFGEMFTLSDWHLHQLV